MPLEPRRLPHALQSLAAGRRTSMRHQQRRRVSNCPWESRPFLTRPSGLKLRINTTLCNGKPNRKYCRGIRRVYELVADKGGRKLRESPPEDPSAASKGTAQSGAGAGFSLGGFASGSMRAGQGAAALSSRTAQTEQRGCRKPRMVECTWKYRA